MVTQIFDRKTVGIPGTVTPAVQALRDQAVDAVADAEAARDEAETFSATTVALQDAAVSALLSDSASDSSTAGAALVNSTIETGLTPEAAQAIADRPELANTTAAQIEAEVPPLVAAAIADDPTIVDAAELAVVDAAAGLDIVQRTDPGIPAVSDIEDAETLEAWGDSQDRRAMRVRTDGTFEVGLFRQGGRVTADAEIEEPYMSGSQAGGYWAEDVYGTDGLKPQWVLDRWKNRMGFGTNYPYDIIPVLGQSNATQADSPPVTTDDADDRLFSWNRTTGVIEPLAASSAYLGSAFAREYIRRIPPGRRVIIVPGGVGSTGFSSTSLASVPAGYHGGRPGTWDRTLTSDPNNLAIRIRQDVLDAVAAAGTGARIVAVLWSQGEDDRVPSTDGTTRPNGMTQAEYAAALDDLIWWLRAEWATPSLPWVAGSMTPEIESGTEDPVGTASIAKALRDTPRRVVGTAYVFGPENMFKFNDFRVHWNSQGQRERGRMFLDAVYRAKLNVTTCDPMPPQNTRVTRSGGVARVEWDFPSARVTAFEVQTSTDSGVSWTTQTIANPLDQFIEQAVVGGTPVWARVRTTNEVGTSDYSMIAKG